MMKLLFFFGFHEDERWVEWGLGKEAWSFARLWRIDGDMRAKEGHLFGTYIEPTNISTALLVLSHIITQKTYTGTCYYLILKMFFHHT